MHYKLDVMAEKGFVVLNDYEGPAIAPREWESLEFMDWKSGGDTNFAPLASATGEMDCRGFWDHGKADKYGVWTSNCQIAPSLVNYVEKIGGNYGRVRVIKLNPSDEATALRQLHLDDNNRLNPEGTGWVVRSWLELDDTAGQSMFILREDKEDPSTETRVKLHPGMQLVIDTERLWHVVWHPGPKPRYALITSWESDKTVDGWIKRELAGKRKRQLQGARAALADLFASWPSYPGRRRTAAAAGTARVTPAGAARLAAAGPRRSAAVLVREQSGRPTGCRRTRQPAPASGPA
jgi:hypothetical protein